KAEQDKLASDAAHQQLRMKMELTLEQQRFELERELKLLDAKLKADEHRAGAIAKTAAALPRDGAPHVAGLIAALVHHLSAPKRAVREAQGRVSHIESVPAPAVPETALQ